jgi:hypothetical protein
MQAGVTNQRMERSARTPLDRTWPTEQSDGARLERMASASRVPCCARDRRHKRGPLEDIGPGAALVCSEAGNLRPVTTPRLGRAASLDTDSTRRKAVHSRVKSYVLMSCKAHEQLRIRVLTYCCCTASLLSTVQRVCTVESLLGPEWGASERKTGGSEGEWDHLNLPVPGARRLAVSAPRGYPAVRRSGGHERGEGRMGFKWY